MAYRANIRPGEVVQRATYLLPVDIADPPPPAASAGAAAGVVSRDGATLRRPVTAVSAAMPGIRSGGRDVTRSLAAGGLTFRRNLGEPWTAGYQLRLDSTPTDDPLTTEDGRAILTEDGREIILEGSDPGQPGMLEIVRFSAPTATYRDTVIALDPVLYWSMDSAGRETLDDYSGSAVNRGTLDTAKTKTRRPAPVPYGGAVEMSGADAVTGPTLPAGSARTVMLWIKGPAADFLTFLDAGGMRLWRHGAHVGLEGCGGLMPVDAAQWTHVAFVVDGTACSVTINGGASTGGLRASRPFTGSLGGGPVTMSGPLEVDEVSIHLDALTEAQIAAAYAARSGERLFTGIVKKMDIAGRGARSERLIIDCAAVGLDESFKGNRAKKEFSTDGTETVRQLVQRLLEDELPGQPITADGLDVDELVAPFRENLETIHRVIKRLEALHLFVWHLHPMGELTGHRRSAAPGSGVVLDEDVNLAADPSPMSVDARLFRSQQTVAGAGGRPEVDVFESDGRQRLFRLTYEVDWGQTIAVDVDGAAQSVDSTGRFVFRAAFAADQGTNAILIPGSAAIPASGARITVRYRSRRTQAVSVADIDAIRKYGLRSDIVFDPSPNNYTLREAMSAAFLAANASPTRRIAVRGQDGKIPIPVPGRTYVVNAREAYGVEGGEPWLLSSAVIAADPRFRAICTLDLQQGPYQPLRADFYDRIANTDAQLIPND